jgi:hypothetical protein
MSDAECTAEEYLDYVCAAHILLAVSATRTTSSRAVPAALSGSAALSSSLQMWWSVWHLRRRCREVASCTARCLQNLRERPQTVDDQPEVAATGGLVMPGS